MIQKLRRKIVLALMCVELAFVLAILTGLYLNARTGFIRMSTDAMHQAARRSRITRAIPAAELPPALRPESDSPRGRFSDSDTVDVPLALLTADAQGQLGVTQNLISAFSDAELIQLGNQVLALEEEEGFLRDSRLRYLRAAAPNGRTHIVFASTTLEQALLRNQAFLSLLIALLSSAAFWAIAFLLSRSLVQPISDAFERERQFVADASHELKTPLTVVLSNAEMLLSSGAVTDDRSLRRLDNIRAESRRMRALVEDLLSLARLDTGRTRAAHTPQPLSYITACALSGFEPALFDAGRSLQEDVEPNLYVNGEADRLRELLDILIDNACKYSQPDSSIYVTLRAVHKEAVLCVTSEGNPIPASEHSAIFRRFYRRDPSRSQQPGYGLGLAIAQSIVSEHGGHIGIRNDTPHSNTFFVHLPLCPAQAADE